MTGEKRGGENAIRSTRTVTHGAYPMRRPHLRLIVLICVALPLAIVLWASIGPTPRLTITPHVIDFGEVTEREASRQLTIRNPGLQPALVRLAADCDCIRLSRAEVKIPSQADATVDVILNQKVGDRRERFFTFLESELGVTTVTDEGTGTRRIPIAARFFEPYAIDRAACQIDGLAAELRQRPIPFSAATPEAGRPTITQVPGFVEKAEVNWSDAFSAGELLVTIKGDTPPGLHEGQIEMRLTTPDEKSPKSLTLPLEARIVSPVRFSPGMAYLGGLLAVDSQTVTMEGVSQIRCSIESLHCDSQWVRLETHDDTTFTVHRAHGADDPLQDSPVIHVIIDVRCEADGVPMLVKENFPVYITSEKGGKAH